MEERQGIYIWDQKNFKISDDNDKELLRKIYVRRIMIRFKEMIEYFNRNINDYRIDVDNIDDTSELMKMILPHCGENFIRIPLWEEGNYCFELNLWYVIPHDELPAGVSLDNYVQNAIRKTSELYPGYFIDFDYEDEQVREDRTIVQLSIFQDSLNYLDKNFVINYDLNSFLKVGIILINLLKTKK